jgi:alkanesulfonate monooxygenase SsuD/methylene tetrahydromethanopterin reductase-like flavin-dependent oxidoreductase (luciferase family)
VAAAADVAFVTPRDVVDAAAVVTDLEMAQATAGRVGPPVRVFADLAVVLGETAAAARDRRDRLDGLAGAGYAGDTDAFVGTPSELADLLLEWRKVNVPGFRLRPAALPYDLIEITRGLVPQLQRRRAYRTGYGAGDLRTRLGLPRPDNRYAAV